MNKQKDVLDYTDAELQGMTTEKLKGLLEEAEYGKSLNNTQQLAEKTLINGLYGALANKYFPLFNEDMAAAITGNGRYYIRLLANYIEDALQGMHPSEKSYVIYGDTDSVYFQIEPFMEMYQKKNPDLSIDEYVDWADQFEKKVIQPVIQKSIDDFADELNAYNRELIGAEREIISSDFMAISKKMYFARVRDSEGTRYPADDPDIKVMGLDIIKSSTPKWAKKYLKEAIPHILDKDENDLRNWLKSIKREFVNTELNDIAAVGSANNLDYDLERDTVPIGSRAAIRHNIYIKENGLENLYAPIQPGEKAKRLFLTTPNPFNSNIIAFTNDTFVREIEKHNCVDYDTNFYKNFMKPLENMVNCLKYNLEKETEELDDW